MLNIQKLRNKIETFLIKINIKKMEKKDCGVFFKFNEGWQAKLTFNNGDIYSTEYFKKYTEAAKEYNRVVKKLKDICGIRNMFRWGIPTKLLSLSCNDNSIHKIEQLRKKTRSGKKY